MNPASYPTALSRSTGCENRTHGLLVPNQALYQTEPIRYMQQKIYRNIAGDEPARKRMLSSYAVTSSVKRLYQGLNPEISAVAGLRNNQLSYRAIFGLLLKYAHQIHTLFALRNKPNWQGETRTHGVSLWLIYSQLPSPLGYLPIIFSFFLSHI